MLRERERECLYRALMGDVALRRQKALARAMRDQDDDELGPGADVRAPPPDRRYTSLPISRGVTDSRNTLCSGCRRALQKEEVAYVRRRYDVSVWGIEWSHHLYCESCVRGWHPSWWETRGTAAPCVTCGQMIAGSRGREQPRTCSRECGYHRPRRRAVRHEPRACDVCGETFTPRRADARYCSPACRQRAYRKRRKAALAEDAGR
jgi:hypothetical protein